MLIREAFIRDFSLLPNRGWGLLPEQTISSYFYSLTVTFLVKHILLWILVDAFLGHLLMLPKRTKKHFDFGTYKGSGMGYD